MAKPNIYTGTQNLNLKDGLIRFGKTFASNPYNSNEEGMWVDSNNRLNYSKFGTNLLVETQSTSPSISPSKSPSKSPSLSPSVSPSPSLSPSKSPSVSPSASVSPSPSLSPSISPSVSPS